MLAIAIATEQQPRAAVGVWGGKPQPSGPAPAAWNPVSRRYLNRASFRLLIYALIAYTLPTDVSSVLIGYSGCMICAVKLGPSPACGGTAWFANVCILFAAIMFFSIALNLQLVLVHGVNGQGMEKYYLSATAIMVLVCTIPPYAAGAFGAGVGIERYTSSADAPISTGGHWWPATNFPVPGISSTAPPLSNIPLTKF
ncbi:hypothetical protein B0H16DRAFT_1446469 [Mycena metata]|uniref:Uncharacterized protein n=1 Tax=Mycena metata TaxID=1033252 RepID=A0AAD7P172_9AGAR|nr:hypothetical protein B0H16DRAFT_1446469 [Mycena metata]